MGSDDAACTVTMTTSGTTRPRLDTAATLKYTAVKVDVSALTERCKCKVFVISSQTTSRDLADMVLRKLKNDVKGHVTGTCLMGQSLDGNDKVMFGSEEKVLGFYGSSYRNTVTLELVPIESVTLQQAAPSSERTSREIMDKIKAGNLAESKKNGMTLPGYQKPEVAHSGGIGSSFVTSTPNPDSTSDSVTSDSGFLIHYEPHCDNADSRAPSDHNGNKTSKVPARSRSFELARDGSGEDKLNLSSGNASDSGMGASGNGNVRSKFRPSPKDGFQILQSQHSAWTPFSRHMSDGVIGTRALKPTASVNDVSSNRSNLKTHNAEIIRRRSLPKMNLSEEQLREKKRYLADVFSSKLQRFLSRRTTRTYGQPDRPPLRRNSTKDDDAMSVTSQEVAEIMSSASPMRPYEDDVSDIDASRQDRASPKREQTISPKNVFQPLTVTNQTGSQKSRQKSADTDADQRSVSDYAEKSMTSFISSNDQEQSTPPHRKCSTKTKNSTAVPSPGENRESRGRTQVTSSQQRGVPLFALLTTHFLTPVIIRRQVTSSPHTGLRLCDVSYVKCVRYVVRHWAKGSRQLSIESKLADRLLVAVSGVDRHLADVTTGNVCRGDVVVEINGTSALPLSARDVISQMLQAEVTSLVVARSRLNVDRATSP